MLHAPGQLTEPEFLQTTASPDLKADLEPHAETWFYAGMKQLLAGVQAAASSDFQKCLTTSVRGFEEYQSAAAELKLMNGTAN